MSYNINGTTINLTRGDTLLVQLAITKNGEEYTPLPGDSIRFALKNNKFNATKTDYEDEHPLISKVIPANTLILRLDPEDTKSLNFGEYVYDIQITFADGIVDTFITNAKFKITPEVD